MPQAGAQRYNPVTRYWETFDPIARQWTTGYSPTQGYGMQYNKNTGYWDYWDSESNRWVDYRMRPQGGSGGLNPFPVYNQQNQPTQTVPWPQTPTPSPAPTPAPAPAPAPAPTPASEPAPTPAPAPAPAPSPAPAPAPTPEPTQTRIPEFPIPWTSTTQTSPNQTSDSVRPTGVPDTWKYSADLRQGTHTMDYNPGKYGGWYDPATGNSTNPTYGGSFPTNPAPAPSPTNTTTPTSTTPAPTTLTAFGNTQSPLSSSIFTGNSLFDWNNSNSDSSSLFGFPNYSNTQIPKTYGSNNVMPFGSSQNFGIPSVGFNFPSYQS